MGNPNASKNLHHHGERTAWLILKRLTEKPMSAQEIAAEMKLPDGTVRCEFHFLRNQGLIEPVPKEKRGTPMKPTQKGLEEAKKGHNHDEAR